LTVIGLLLIFTGFWGFCAACNVPVLNVGTEDAPFFSATNIKLHPAFEKVRNKVAGACDFCAGAFEVREALEKDGVPLLREHAGHPSVRTLVDDGFEVITF
jgi:hypothetical protein